MHEHPFVHFPLQSLMPIKVSCTCGAAFAAKDELAGRTVACPKCQQPLTIPGATAAQRPAPAQRSAPAPAQQAVPDAPSIFDDAGIKAKQHTGQVCPSCYHPMKSGTILCVHCGFSLQLGRKMEMQIHGKGTGGHGESAEQALQRAAITLEEDKREERKKLSEGMPWWGYLLLFVAACSLLTMMMILPPATATGVALMFLWGLGILLGIYANIMIIIIAFKDNVAQGLCVLFIPCYAFIYTIMHWDQCGTFFLLNLASGFIQGLAQVILAFTAGDANQAAEIPHSTPIPIVRFLNERPYC